MDIQSASSQRSTLADLQNTTQEHEVPVALAAENFSQERGSGTVPQAIRDSWTGDVDSEMSPKILEILCDTLPDDRPNAQKVVEECKAKLALVEAINVLEACMEMNLLGSRLEFAREECSTSFFDFVERVKQGDQNFWLIGKSPDYVSGRGILLAFD